MERKIGEIFEVDGKWYQCVEANENDNCNACNLQGLCIIMQGKQHVGNCMNWRNDNKRTVYKKLEKVGEPMTVNGKNVQLLKTTIANCDNCAFYNVNCDFTCYPRKCHGGEEGTYVEIKQTKEEMKDKKLNLKPFDLEAAKAGEPVCTRDGRKARIICFDAQCDKSPIIALIENGKNEEVHKFHKDGKLFGLDEDEESFKDLMMLPEKKEGWINIYNADTTFYYVDGRVFETKDEAVKEAKEEVEKEQREKNEYIDTIRVEWEDKE